MDHNRRFRFPCLGETPIFSQVTLTDTDRFPAVCISDANPEFIGGLGASNWLVPPEYGPHIAKSLQKNMSYMEWGVQCTQDVVISEIPLSFSNCAPLLVAYYLWNCADDGGK